MAFDQNSAPTELRVLNVAPIMVEEPLISPAGVTTPPTPDSVSDYFYPTSAPAGAASATWCVRPIVSPPSIGLNYGNRVVAGNALNLGSWVRASNSNNNNTGLHNVCNDGVPVNVSGFSYGAHGGTRVADDTGDDSNSGRKVKFLCSFGGKILPRPSDGMLRYVGGQTRIISVKKDVSYNDLVLKMVDTYGQPVVIKYQLPEEDLDALVSVACPDDVENMMEEYGKLVERSPDGSAKLRVFLFPLSEVDLSGAAQSGDLQDTGQKYFDAVNGFIDGYGVCCGFKRKESITSAASTQNSDLSGIENIDSPVAGQGDSASCVLSPREYVAASPDTSVNLAASESNTPVYPGASSSVPFGMPAAKTGPTCTSYTQNEIELEKSAPVTYSQQPFELHQSGMEIPPPSPYLNHAEYVHLPPQTGFPNSQLLGKTGPVFAQHQFHNNTTPGLAFRQVIPGAQMTMTQPSSRVGIRPNVIQPQPLVQPQHNHLNQYSDENTSGIRIVQLPAEHSYNTYQVPVNQVPSVIVGGNRGWVQVPPQEHVVFSDGTLPQQVITPEKINRVEECSMCQKKLPHAHSDPVVPDQHDGGSGPVPDSSPSYNSFPMDDNVKAQATKRVAPMVASPLKEGVVEQGFSTRPSDISKLEVHNGVRNCTDNTGISYNFEPQHEGGRNFIQKPEEFDHSMNSFIQETIGRTDRKHSSRDGLGTMGTTPPSYPDDVVRQHMAPVEAWVKQDEHANRHVSNDIPIVDEMTLHTPECVAQGSSKEYTNELTGVVSKSDAVNNWIRQGYVRPVDGRNDILKIHNADGYVSNDRCLLPVDKSLDYKSQIATEEEVILDNNFVTPKLIVDADKIKMVGVQPSSSKEILYRHNSRTGEDNDIAQPPVSGATQSNIVHHHKNDSTSSTSSPSFMFCDMQDSPNSVFGNQDPWSIPHGTYKKSNLDAQLDGDLFESFKQNLTFENGWCGKVSTEDQQLKVVAEDVAASVLHPCAPSNPNLQAGDVSCRKNIEDGDVQNNAIDAMCRDITQDVKSNPPEKGNFGFPTSGVGRLQIIKNCDLEELTELGSGTFGTVYHGKWRGTDVAIKRITDRCFAGKPSEQERMRDDFWNEAIKLADLHHPNVVAFYGVVLDGPGDSVATVTEYMANGSLRTALQKNERNLDKRRRLLIAMDVAFGMEYLHGKNIVHFDLKSDNLLVNLRDPHRPICKVGDLGLSKVKCQTLISGGVRGTLPWMAPELLNGSSSLVSEKVDVFSFGIAMWELLTGEEPYADLHYGAIIGGIVSNTLRPPIPESCDVEWSVLMERCWSSEPSERPTFTDIADELRSMASKRQNQQLQPSPLSTQVNK
ncbi:uncharacterized protein LOC127073445 isoform X2 [Lathyrus oleraceus]|uniref:Protein kinase domain-containing protein n=1 Tax=Pisum sativum TaxID=3888 RepID=A0A9D4X9G6_PEA|nr:uncharacterized protein LOC127073445 isoform X2 [Pisum sativum]KAI5416027.1 hypothetical protein KIW84_041174 [Pisum sativum]